MEKVGVATQVRVGLATHMLRLQRIDEMRREVTFMVTTIPFSTTNEEIGHKEHETGRDFPVFCTPAAHAMLYTL